jgi:hypothetical protein
MFDASTGFAFVVRITVSSAKVPMAVKRINEYKFSNMS